VKELRGREEEAEIDGLTLLDWTDPDIDRRMAQLKRKGGARGIVHLPVSKPLGAAQTSQVLSRSASLEQYRYDLQEAQQPSHHFDLMNDADPDAAAAAAAAEEAGVAGEDMYGQGEATGAIAGPGKSFRIFFQGNAK
jgi:hypothetical protein